MATSPKFKSASLPRYATSTSTPSRRYSQRQLVILAAFALLVTSGTMLIFHVMTGTLSPGRSRNTGVGCNKDAEFSVIRWANSRDGNSAGQETNNNNDNNRDAGSPYYRFKNSDNDSDNDSDNNNIHDRPRAAIPHLDKQEPQSEQGLDQQLSQGNTNDNSNNNGGPVDETASEVSGEDGLAKQNDYAPFEDTLDRDDNIQYLTYLPYAGITNQFYGVLRGMEVAKALGRTLIIPPITASSHDKSKQNQPWSKFLDLDRFQQLTGAKVIEFHKLRDAEMTEYNQLKCGITCGFGSKRTIDFTAKGFLKQWKLNVTLSSLQTDTASLSTIIKTLTPLRRDKYICISNTYKISVKDKSEWERFGQYLYFTPELENFVQEFLDKNLVKPEPVYDAKLKQEVVPTQKYIAIHARRGDFAQYCESNFPGAKMIHCLPSTEQYAQRIDSIQEQHDEIMPVFVATNERRPEELKKFADLGWRYLDHEEMATAEKLGVFGPMMVDQVFMAHAEALVGIQMSTFSRVGALRQRDWHQRKMSYM
ncbi:hypothetical protein BG011_008812 [Mortierella polycephala]|uniref:GDP-fucose protein O-fucosyltransferase 2 n=1 Tax=Mortierella polycephala TaxID=41804 RepID=A0A9P6PNA4_9FUNG|nr:hypothetical protein BG011_008812 [Mortierella polycephala]